MDERKRERRETNKKGGKGIGEVRPEGSWAAQGERGSKQNIQLVKDEKTRGGANHKGS